MSHLVVRWSKTGLIPTLNVPKGTLLTKSEYPFSSSGVKPPLCTHKGSI